MKKQLRAIHDWLFIAEKAIECNLPDALRAALREIAARATRAGLDAALDDLHACAARKEAA